jgi:ankyrin repeat protein
MSAARVVEYPAELLFEAIKKGDASRVRELLDVAPELLKAKAPDGASAILFACYWGHPGMVALFEERGVLLDLFEACAAGRRERVETLLDRAPSLAREFSSDGYPPLGLAVFFGHDEIAAVLLEYDADVNAASRNHQHVTPLHAAVARRNARLAAELLARGADPDAAQTAGFTALHTAAYHGDREIVELLLGYGADPRRTTDTGKTAAALAAERGNTDVAALLVPLTA